MFERGIPVNKFSKAEAPHKATVKERLQEYIQIRRTTPVSVVDVIAWFCAAASLTATLYSIYFGYGS